MTSIASITQWLSSINLQGVGFYFRLIRWVVMAILIASWPKLVAWVGNKYKIQYDYIEFWQSQRVRIAAWFLIFDLLICENILTLLMRIL